jgi:long-chain acyl-CoA synthetase
MREPRPERLAHDSLIAAAALRPDAEAVADEQERLTNGELYELARRFARVLQDGGLARGERVVLLRDNTVPCVAGIFGVWLAGGIVTVLKPQTRTERLLHILADAEASFLVAEGRLATTAVEAAAVTPSLRAVFATGGGSLPAGVVDLERSLASASDEVQESGTIPSDLAALIYTSGTTGRSKGVMATHGGLVFSTGSIAEYLRLDASDRILSILPLAFSYGLSQLLLSAKLGATLLLERSFTYPARTMQRIRDERATVLPAVPTVFATMLGMAHDGAYESVRCLTNAAAGLPPALHTGLRELFPEAALYRMYGQTECVRVCYLEPELVDQKPTSVGRAIPGTEVLVLDEHLRPVGPGEIGVLHVRGPHVMLGYWRAPELTAGALRDGRYLGERMLCTGDYFTTDEDGFLYFVDRSDDIIKSRGEKVSSVEVENALYEIAGVRQAAVIGVPDELLGHAVRAYVVLDEGCELVPRDIIRESRARLEGFMVPREVVLVDELPQTESGKVRKKSLVEALAAPSRPRPGSSRTC